MIAKPASMNKVAFEVEPADKEPVPFASFSLVYIVPNWVLILLEILS